MTTFMIATRAHYVIPEIKAGITSYLLGRGWQVWHWFDDLWLTTNLPADMTAQRLSGELEQGVAGLSVAEFLVIQLENVPSYYGRLNDEAWGWIAHFWGPPKSNLIPRLPGVPPPPRWE